MVNRVIIGAHYGTSGWLIQRISAIVMSVYTLIVIAILLISPPTNYVSWKALFSRGDFRCLTFLFFISLCLHAWIGMRDIFMDYLKPTWIRLSAHTIAILILAGYAGWAAKILWKL